ncbi:MAG: nicotinate-nucleotide adenylyltransferase [Coriobacteriaceae bacterium]|nr:nicotinate-nucleotide adenylyltransferase [Coriobacteriaceae bacterium]
MTLVSKRFDRLGFDDPETPRRLGIMGGTFDPIHVGHLACAESVREAFGLDAVIFIPAGIPVYKKHQKVTEAPSRLAMCELAVADNPFFDVSALEVERAGDTYTVDTLRQLRAHYPANVELFFITGADAVAHIISWRESRSIAGLARFIAVTRPGHHLSEEQKASLAARTDIDISYTEVTALAISSSGLRERVRKGRPIRYLTPWTVCCYIEEHGLYGATLEGSDESPGSFDGTEACAPPAPVPLSLQAAAVLSEETFEDAKERLRLRLSPERFAHSVSVAETAANLAAVYGVSEAKARLAGLLHDWDKCYDDTSIKERVLELGMSVDAEVFDAMPRLLHAETAAVALVQEFPGIGADILQAIARHTAGALSMSELDMVVYIADVIEPLRPYQAVDALTEAVGRMSLEDLFLLTYKQVFAYLVERDYRVHPGTIRVWNHYISRARQRKAKDAAAAEAAAPGAAAAKAPAEAAAAADEQA